MDSSRFIIAASIGVVLCLFSCLGEVAAQEQSESVSRVQVQPRDLGELLSLLPDCPDEWIVRRSQARTLYQDGLEAYAMREYRQFTLPDQEKRKDVSKPETVVVVIRDTCGRGPNLKPFREETAPISGGDFKLGTWANYPAMLVRTSKSRRALRFLVKDRFVVEVVFTGNNLKALNWWLRRCNVKALTDNREEKQIVLRDQVTLRFIDELEPDRNRSYAMPLSPDVPEETEVPGKSAVVSRENQSRDTESE